MPQGKCPNNGFVLNYNEGDKFVDCPYCDTKHAVSDLETTGSSARSKATNAPKLGASVGVPAFLGFDNPDSGIVFIQNFFDTYDWEAFKETPWIEVEDIKEVVENNKMKNGAIGATWYIDFKAVSVPLSQKIKGLKELAAKMGEKYDVNDSSECMALFDIYKQITNYILEEKDNILKRLDVAAKYAQNFALNPALLKEIQGELKEVTSLVEGIKEVKVIEDIPEYIDAQNKSSVEIEKKLLAELGINAKDIYEEGVRLFEQGGSSKFLALASFDKIRGYKDTNNYIKKINNYFNLDSFFHFGDKDYIYKKPEDKEEDETIKVGCVQKIKNIFKKKPSKVKTETKKVGCVDKIKNIFKKKGSNDAEALAEENAIATSFALFEVVNGVPSKQPIIEKINEFITYYGNKYYFMRYNKGLFSFDLVTYKEELLVEGKKEDFEFNSNDRLDWDYAVDRSTLLLMKKLKPEEKKGCFGIIKKKKKKEEKLLNNYCLCSINLLTAKCKVIINELVDIANLYNRDLFYLVAKRIEKPKKGCADKLKSIFSKPASLLEPEKEYDLILMTCDLETGENKPVLSEACKIENVVDKKVIYTLYKSNSLNQDLRVFDMNDGSDVLIEDNILSYYNVFDKKIFYTVGNKDYRPLYCNSLTGGERKELMTNAERVVDVRAGWMYVIKGTGYNKILLKVNIETGNRVIIATQIATIEQQTATHIYYKNIYNELLVVRRDGLDENLIGEDIDLVNIDKDAFYYTRNEKVEEKKSTIFGTIDAVEGLSLYSMDKDGKNVKKEVFNVDAAKNFDEEFIYYNKKETVRFKVSEYVKKNKPVESYKYYDLDRYFKYNKLTRESELVLTLGLPEEQEGKKGCFKKKQNKITYEETPVPREYKRRGLKPVGAIEREAEVKAAEENALPFLSKDGKNAQGCSNKGCASAIKKDKKDTKSKGCGKGCAGFLKK